MILRGARLFKGLSSFFCNSKKPQQINVIYLILMGEVQNRLSTRGRSGPSPAAPSWLGHQTRAAPPDGSADFIKAEEGQTVGSRVSSSTGVERLDKPIDEHADAR